MDYTEAKKVLSALVAERSFRFFDAGCTQETISGTATVGQLATAEGLGLSEEVVTEYFGGVIAADNGCSGNQVASCLEILSTGEIPEDTSGAPEALPARQVSNFLWKPDSESPYNPGGVSILLDPCDVNVFVNGSQLLDYPTGNGRCVTVRSAQEGCFFGAATVEVKDKATGEVVYFGSQPSVLIANGCTRFEYDGVGSVGGNDEEPEFNCDTAPTTVQYRPELEECGGNAAVILSGSFQGAFSVQLRLPDGGDRLDEDCALANCTPYKVQRYIDGAGTKTACFGAPGNANVMNNVHHTSIKMAGDDSDPDRFCIPDMRVAVN